jgi:hypothetical protein
MTELSTNIQEEALKTYQEIQSHIIARAWKDEAYKQELLSNPKAIFEREFKVQLPVEMNVNVVEENNNNIYMVLPKRPDLPNGELSEEQLEAVAGGLTPGLAVAGAIVAVAIPIIHGAVEEYNSQRCGN